jgi:hypothetical protein
MKHLYWPRLNRRGFFMERKMKAICKYCDSNNVTRDACVKWDEFNQVWSLVAVYDNGDCNDCGANGDNIIEWIDENGENV